MSAKKLFISYSHADAALLATLKTHLKPLERADVIVPWFDSYLLPGDDIDARVRSALEKAELIALLVSPDFLASDYCYDIEMQTAVNRHERGEARVIPIILRECQWHTAPFGRLAAVPTDGKPITSNRWMDKDEAWTIVAKGIKSAAEAETRAPPAAIAALPAQSAMPPSPRPIRIAIKAKKKLTDKDRDQFRHSAFEQIAREFDAALSQLDGSLSGSFRRIDANRFTGTIYQSGQKVAGCTIWIGGGAWGADSISYVGNDGGETGSINESLSVEQLGDDVGLRPQMASARGKSDSLMSVDVAAQFLWDKFVERLQQD